MMRSIVKISIHASRGGSDLRGIIIARYINCISIHASRGGSDICRIGTGAGD